MTDQEQPIWRDVVPKALCLAAFMAAAILCSCQPMKDWAMLGYRSPEQQANARAELETLQRIETKRRLRR